LVDLSPGRAYPDTSFLFSLYAPQVHSPIATAYFAAMKAPLHLTSLNRFELINAIQLAVFREAIAKSAGLRALERLAANINCGALVVLPCDWAAVHGRALQIALHHTGKSGYRGFDILHVAMALELGAKEFLTFDAKQTQLAKAVGLKVRV